MQKIYAATRISNKIHETNYALMHGLVKQAARAHAAGAWSVSDHVRKAVKFNGLNGMRLGFALWGEPAADVGWAMFIAVPNPASTLFAGALGMIALVGTGTPARFVQPYSGPIARAAGVIAEYGVAGLPQFAAVAGARVLAERKHHAAAKAAMAVATLFSVVLEPLRAAMAASVLLVQLPFGVIFGTALAIAGGCTALFSKQRRATADYLFFADNIRPLALRYEAEVQTKQLVTRVQPYFTELQRAGDRAEALRCIKSRASAAFVAEVRDVARNLQKYGKPEVALALVNEPHVAQTLEQQYRRTSLFVHPDKLQAGEAPQVHELCEATFATLAVARSMARAARQTTQFRFAPRQERWTGSASCRLAIAAA